MPTFNEKIAELKDQMNSTYSAYTQVLTETYNGNYVSAIIHALRTMGKQARTCIKTIWIPIQSGQRYYNINPSLYTKDKIEYTKSSDLALVSFKYSQLPISGPIQYSGSAVITKAEATTIEAIERGEFLDWVKFAQSFRQDTTGIKVNTDPGAGIGSNSIEISSVGEIISNNSFKFIPSLAVVSVDNILVNLDKLDNILYTGDKVSSYESETVTLYDTVHPKFDMAGFWHWDIGDKICITNSSNPSFISVTFECIPKFNYLSSAAELGTTQVPVLPQFYDDIDDLAIKYLFRILAQKDPDKINLYVGMVKSGLIRSEPEVIRDVKVRSNTVDAIEIANYQPYAQRYGR